MSNPNLSVPTQRPTTILTALLLAFLLIAPFGFSGCKTGATGVRPAQAFTVPDWNTLDIRTLAYMGTGGSTGEETDRQTAEVLVEEQLLSGQDRFVILSLGEAHQRASSKGAGDAFEKVQKVWRDQRLVDGIVAKDLSAKMGVDGLILGDLGEWKQERVDWSSEGTSSTEVNLRLAIYSGKTGLVAWEAQKLARKESVGYRPMAAGSGVYTDESGVSRAERPQSVTPDPPRPEVVAVEAIQSLIAAFPEAPAK